MPTWDFVRFFRTVRNGILGVLEISEEKGGKPASRPFQWLSVLLTLTQLLSFVTANVGTSVWPSSLSPVETIASLTNLRGYKRFVATPFVTAAIWLAFTWTTVLFGIMVRDLCSVAGDAA